MGQVVNGMMQFSEYFTLEELSASETAVRKHIDNTPPPHIVANLKVASVGMDKVRALLNNEIHVNSGYRCPELNEAIGGSAKSAHMEGFAVDFTCRGFGPPIEVAKALVASDLKWDQLIQEGTWCHISFAPAMRQQVLTAHFNESGTFYTVGL